MPTKPNLVKPSTVRVAFWLAARPRFWADFWRRLKHNIASKLLPAPMGQGRSAATAWAHESAINENDALSSLGIQAIPDMSRAHPDLVARAAEIERGSAETLGGGGGIDVIFRVCEGLQAKIVVETGVAYGWSSLAILALRAAGLVDEEPRVDSGLAYLTDRRCSNGGWNVGNPRMFDQELPPRAVPSACALLALARCKPALIDSADVEALKQEIDQDAGVLALAWGVMALRVMEEESADFLSLLANLQLPDGSWNRNSYHTALAAMAFSEKLPTCLTG